MQSQNTNPATPANNQSYPSHTSTYPKYHPSTLKNDNEPTSSMHFAHHQLTSHTSQVSPNSFSHSSSTDYDKTLPIQASAPPDNAYPLLLPSHSNAPKSDTPDSDNYQAPLQ